ncbi:hypothetical protein C8Q75DRAFT_272177 [Abortiporus biennis]|nr:hypothetical protein C8Q75DRAFT_272177 [Abortiporus biennis]
MEPHMSFRMSICRIVQASSPKNDSVHWTTKVTRDVYEWHMKPSPLEELLIMRLFQSIELTFEQVASFYHKFGPSTRLIFRHGKRFEIFEEQFKSKIRNLDSAALYALVFRTRAFNLFNDNLTHWIFGIYPSQKRWNVQIKIFTRYIYDILKQAFGERWKTNVLDGYRFLKSDAETHGSASYILEDQLHDVLTKGVSWNLTRLTVRKMTPKNAIYEAFWTADDEHRRLVVSPNTLIVAPGEEVETTPSPLSVYTYAGNEPMDWWYNPGYYQPVARNQATINSFVVNPKEKAVYAFQFTVAEEHNIKTSGVQWLEYKYPHYKRHYFIFSDNDSIDVPIPRNYDNIWTSRWHVRVTENQLFMTDIG